MKESERQAGEWLRHEDASQRIERELRLVWLAQQMPDSEILLFHGGWLTKQLFEEGRYCFVYGQYLAAIIMAFGWVDRTIASLLYAAGDNDARHLGVAKLLARAKERNWLTDGEFEKLNRVRDLRNNVSHFRGPLHHSGYEARSVEKNTRPSETAEQDARDVLQAAFNLLRRSAE